MNDLAKNVVLWIVIAVVLATVVSNFSGRTSAVQEMPYSTFLTHVKDGTVSQVTFTGDKITGCARPASSSSSTTPRRTIPR